MLISLQSFAGYRIVNFQLCCISDAIKQNESELETNKEVTFLPYYAKSMHQDTEQ